MITNLLLLLTVASAPADATVETMIGDSVTGKLVSMVDKTIALSDKNGTRQELAFSELLRLTFKSPDAGELPPDAATVELIDGTILKANSFVVENGDALMELVDGGSAETSTRNIRSVLFRQFDRPELAEEWESRRHEELTSDAVVSHKPATGLSVFSVVVGKVDLQQVEFKLGDTDVQVGRERIDGLLYFHAVKRELPSPLCKVVDTNGNTLTCRTLSLDGQNLDLRTTSGVQVKTPLSAVKLIDFSVGKIVYLSDLTPASSVRTPFLLPDSLVEFDAKIFRFRVDESFAGKQLELFTDSERNSETGSIAEALSNTGVKSYQRGIAVRADSRLTYKLPDDFNRLSAVAGIDPASRPNGDVELTIRGDGRELFKSMITGRDRQPLVIDVPINGVKRITFEIGSGKQKTVGDHLNLCELRVVK